MAIKNPTGFNITSKEPIDTRLVLSKQEMREMSDYQMPNQYFAVCSDDGKLYLYNISNPISGETGKFKVLESGGGGGTATWGNIIGTLSNQTDLNMELNKKLSYEEYFILKCELPN